MLTPETIREFQEAVGGFCWQTDYATFCRKLGREPDLWTQTKWQSLQTMTHGLGAFDAATLARLLTPEEPPVALAALEAAGKEPWTAEEILRREG